MKLNNIIISIFIVFSAFSGLYTRHRLDVMEKEIAYVESVSWDAIATTCSISHLEQEMKSINKDFDSHVNAAITDEYEMEIFIKETNLELYEVIFYTNSNKLSNVDRDTMVSKITRLKDNIFQTKKDYENWKSKYPL